MKPVRFDNNRDALDYVLDASGNELRLATPLGLGKPNVWLNALYQRVKHSNRWQLDIFTALTLLKPAPSSELEAALLEPILARWYGNYPDLDYALDLQRNQLPAHIRVFELFLKSGDWLHNPSQQQHFIASHYNHIGRDMAARAPNIVAQAIAAETVNGQTRYSLSCNPDVTAEVLERLRAVKQPVLMVGVVNRELPFMEGDAQVNADFFDVIIDSDENHHTLFCSPWPRINRTDYAIGLHASSLVRDGGTLQIGIGSLGDAICHSLLLRQHHNADYRELLRRINQEHFPPELHAEPFHQGLYSATEMLVAGLWELYRGGVLKRPASASDATVLHAGFFLGPTSFYQALRELTPEQRRALQMMRIDFTNQLYGSVGASETEKRASRTKASFINTCMMVSLTGHAVSDGLANGQVVSGVGGQHNFVSMAHALDDADSILLLRSWRLQHGKPVSNIVTEYPNTTVTRHFRDIVITEYGIARLRGKTDSEVIAALIEIADSRFQSQLIDWAVKAGKLVADFQLALQYRHNTPERLKAELESARELLPSFPFGCDFTDEELAIMEVLGRMKQASQQPLLALQQLLKGSFADEKKAADYLARLSLTEVHSLRQLLLKRLFLGNL